MRYITKLLNLLGSFRIFKCNSCGNLTISFKNRWGDFICLACGSSTRSRLFLASLQYLEEFAYMKSIWNKSILHCAPEKYISLFLKAHASNYLMADFSPSRYRDSHFINLDLMNPGFSSCSFDCVICFDVLEHVPSVRNALTEIHRLLKPGGCFISSVPIPFGSSLTTDASVEQCSDPKLLEKIFGLSDHLRMFGSDYREILSDYFSSVSIVESSRFTADIRRKHQLDSEVSFMTPLATRSRSIFFSYK